jgi:hypothetical protein
MSNGINNLNIPTINGLQNLTLDNLDVSTIDGDLFYIDKIEASEIILDHKLTMNNNSWINTNGTTITNIELSYLDNCNSNIQTQINNFNTNNTSLQTQINTHTTQISTINTTLTTHTTQITALQTSDTAQNTAISNINYAIYGQINSITNLQNSDTTQNAILATHTSQISAIQTVNTNQDASLLTISNDMTTLQNKTQNITADNTSTYFSKRMRILSDGEAIQMAGSYTIINAYTTGSTSLDWSIGQPSAGSKKVQLINYKQDSTNIISGINASGLYGRNDVNIYSYGIKLYRGDSTQSGNTLEYSGAIGQLNPSLSQFFISGNGTNSIYIDPGLGSITLNTNTVWLSGGTAAGNGRYSNINMLNAAGTGWETQSSAFTDTLKGQITTNQTNITTLTNRLNDISNFGIIRGYLSGSQIAGRVIPFTVSTVYALQTTIINIGLYNYNSGYTSFFNSIGQCILTNCYINIKFECQFQSGNTGINTLRSRIKQNNGATLYDQTYFQGVKYNSNQTFNNTLHYEVYMKMNPANGSLFYLDTESFFTTSSDGASASIIGVITITREAF